MPCCLGLGQPVAPPEGGGSRGLVISVTGPIEQSQLHPVNPSTWDRGVCLGEVPSAPLQEFLFHHLLVWPPWPWCFLKTQH